MGYSPVLQYRCLSLLLLDIVQMHTCIRLDVVLWSRLVQEVIVKAKDDITFIFKNGFEVRGELVD